MWKQVRLPQMDEASEFAVVASVLVAPGDTVRRGDPVLEVADAERVPAPFDGVVREIHVAEGQEVHVGDAVLTLDAYEETAPTRRSSDGFDAEDRGEERPSSIRTVRRQPHLSTLQPVMLPMVGVQRVRRLARELGVDLDEVEGTGPHGSVTERDLKAYVREALRLAREGGSSMPRAPRALERPPIEVPTLERAESLERAWKEIPQVTLHRRIDARDAMSLIEGRARIDRLRARHVLAAVLVKTTALAVAPVDVLRNEEASAVDPVAIAWAMEVGGRLHLPLIEAADRRSVAEIAREMAELDLQIGAGWSETPRCCPRVAVSDLDERGPVPLVVEPLRAMVAFGEAGSYGPTGDDLGRDLELQLAWDLRQVTTAVGRDLLAFVSRAAAHPLQLLWH